MSRVPILSLVSLLFALALLLPAAPHGLVVGEHGPVGGALVRFEGGAARTDAAGRFRFPGSPGRFTAWKEGYFIAGGRSPLRLEPLPDQDNEAYEWVDPTPD